MSATPLQIALVHATLPRLTRRPQQSAMAFRMHLSRYAPALDNAFLGSPVALLAEALEVITRADALRTMVAPLALAMRNIGMSPRGYMAIHAAMMDMVCEHLAYDVELEDAYAEVIGMILSTMLAEAHGPRSHVLPLAA